MRYDGPYGMMLDLVGTSPHGVDLEWDHPYTGARPYRNPSRRTPDHPYAYARNSPTSLTDPSGLSPIIVGGGLIGLVVACALPQYNLAQQRYGNRSDDFMHCWVSCRVGKTCGGYISELAGLGKETRDRLVALFCDNFPDNEICKGGHGDFWDSLEDLASNHTCVYWEQYAFGCPGGWIGTLFRESCEDCCGRFYA